MLFRSCTEYEQRLGRAEAQARKAEQENAALQQHCQTLTAQNNRLSGQNAALAGSSSTYSRQKESLDAQVSALQERNHSLNDQVAVLRLKNGSLQKEKEKLQERADQAEAALRIKGRELDDARNALENGKEEIMQEARQKAEDIVANAHVRADQIKEDAAAAIQGLKARGIKTVMTIHNLKFQGVWDTKTVQGITGLPDYYFVPDKLEAYKDANMLKGGIVYADKVTTVSHSYAEEIKTPFYGEGLDGLMAARSNDLCGIVNGLDYNDWNPDTDHRIAKTFNVENFRKNKPVNKAALQEELGLDKDNHVMLIGIVSRLTDQKGFDLIDYMMDEMCQDAVQIAVLGTGDPKYENMFRHFAWKYAGKVSANIFYSDDLSHRLYAGCDAY